MRYLPHTPKEIEELLRAIGVRDIDQVFSTIPESLRLTRPLHLPPPLSEIELRNHLRHLSRKNAHGEEWSFFLGGGSYSHYIPSPVSQLLTRGEFLTSYTPYQPEVSQGTLQAIFEYQTMVSEILGMDVANASHYDGSTGTAEAVLMALSTTDRKRVIVAKNLHPEYREVLRTYLKKEDVVEEIPYTPEGTLDRAVLKKMMGLDVACIVAAIPNFFGIVEDLTDVAKMIHEAGGLFITSTSEPLSFGLFKSPGEMEADIAVAEGQSFGIPMSFGGPGLGLFAVKKELVRSIPGRLVGETVDTEGRRGFVLTLATREQHIRRERATSNICTNVALCALAATMTLALWGKAGLQQLAQMNFDRAELLKERLRSIRGIELRFRGVTFNEFVIRTPRDPQKLVESLLKEKIIAGIPLGRWYPELEDSLLVCITEMNSENEIEKFVNGLTRVL